MSEKELLRRRVQELSLQLIFQKKVEKLLRNEIEKQTEKIHSLEQELHRLLKEKERETRIKWAT